MNIFRGTSLLHKFNRPVVTVGTFDGVHRGHQALFTTMKKLAGETGGETLAITFDKHPRMVLNQSAQLRLLNTLDEKIKLIKNTGIENLWILPFTKSFSKLSAEQFIKLYLVERAGVSQLLAGYHHNLGKGGMTNFDDLKKIADDFGFTARKIEEVIIDGQTAGSTIIREALTDGEIQKANRLLGYHYMLNGRIIKGNQIGKRIGFPTANITLANQYKLIPATGVYACMIEWKGLLFSGMGNIGFRPTIDSDHLTIEAHIFDFDRDIYNDTITIYLVQRIRNEKKFDGLDQLKAQLAKDKESVIGVLKEHNLLLST